MSPCMMQFISKNMVNKKLIRKQQFLETVMDYSEYFSGLGACVSIEL